MYSIDDTVIYGTHGVCRITEITEKEFADETHLYYTIIPVFENKSTFFLQVDNENTERKLLNLLSEEEVKKLISAFDQTETVTVANEKQRRDIYKQIVEGGDRYQIAGLLKTLYQRKEEQIAQGKKQHLIDERFMKEAETILFEEFAYVLGLDRKEVQDMVNEKFKL